MTRLIVGFLSCMLFSLSVQPTATPQKFAFIVGIKGYPSFPADNRLEFADADAREFEAFIKSPEGGGFPASNVVSLYNKDANKAALSRQLQSLGRRVGAEDIVYIFFSGHGSLSDPGQAYLMPYDADPTDPAGLGYRADNFIQEIKTKINSKHLIMFIDACHAGAALMADGVAKNGTANTSGLILEEWKKEFKGREPTNLIILSAASNQRSWEDKELRHGIFTHYLIEGLKGAADLYQQGQRGYGDGKVTAGELYRYLLDKVEARSKEKFSIQTPIISPSFDATFPFAILKPLSPKDPIKPVDPPCANTEAVSFPDPNALPACRETDENSRWEWNEFYCNQGPCPAVSKYLNSWRYISDEKIWEHNEAALASALNELHVTAGTNANAKAKFSQCLDQAGSHKFYLFIATSAYGGIPDWEKARGHLNAIKTNNPLLWRTVLRGTRNFNCPPPVTSSSIKPSNTYFLVDVIYSLCSGVRDPEAARNFRVCFRADYKRMLAMITA